MNSRLGKVAILTGSAALAATQGSGEGDQTRRSGSAEMQAGVQHAGEKHTRPIRSPKPPGTGGGVRKPRFYPASSIRIPRVRRLQPIGHNPVAHLPTVLRRYAAGCRVELNPASSDRFIFTSLHLSLAHEPRQRRSVGIRDDRTPAHPAFKRRREADRNRDGLQPGNRPRNGENAAIRLVFQMGGAGADSRGVPGTHQLRGKSVSHDARLRAPPCRRGSLGPADVRALRRKVPAP